MSSRHISNRRDLFNHDHHGGAGKGDKPRTPLNERYRQNFDAIDWGHSNLPEAGNGYRFLNRGELIEQGDQYQWITGEWKNFEAFIGCVCRGDFSARTRADRPIVLQFNPVEHEQTR